MYIQALTYMSLTSVEGDADFNGKSSKPCSKTLPIMLALSLMLSGTYYVKNYASIIAWAQYRHYFYYEHQNSQ